MENQWFCSFGHYILLVMERGEYAYPHPTKKQKEWIRQRDEADEDFEIHHILPAYYAIALLGLAIEEVNAPENLIAIPKDLHRPPHGIHLLPHEVKDRLERGEKYWNDQWDDELRQQALERTRAFEEQGNIFPGKRSV